MTGFTTTPIPLAIMITQTQSRWWTSRYVDRATYTQGAHCIEGFMLTVCSAFQMGSITVPYFALTDEKPSDDQAPLSETGVFGIDGKDGKYIREEKLTITWSRWGYNGPSLVATFGALSERLSDENGPMALWLSNNLRHIWWKWGEVLDYFEEQTDLPVSERCWFGFLPSAADTNLVLDHL